MTKNYEFCCDWSPFVQGGYHCNECCTVFPDFRSRDNHFALKHPDKVTMRRILWASYMRGRTDA